jgi:choline dehydrogenase-like flavoprotein
MVKQDHEFDALVVGSGLTGGIAALALARLGLKTLVLEAGSNLKGSKYTYGTPLSNVFRRLRQLWWTKNQNVQQWHATYWGLNPNLFVDDRVNPYSTPQGKPYYWIRGRQVGGRSHMWKGICLRFSKYELMANALDRKGSSWPLRYEDIAPFYDQIEKLLDVHGERDGLETLPDGQFSPPSPFTKAERHFQGVIKRTFGRDHIIFRGIRSNSNPRSGEKFTRLSSNQTSLAQALQTESVSLRTDAVVCRLTKAQGRLSGVEYLDARTREKHQVTRDSSFFAHRPSRR